MSYRITGAPAVFGHHNKIKVDVETPPDVKWDIYQQYKIDHDPCPLFGLKEGPDGLDESVPWGKNNFVNPPWDKEGIANFAKRAVKEMGKGNNTYMLIPFRPATRYYDYVFEHCTGIDFVAEHVKFVGYNNIYALPLAIFKFEVGMPSCYEKVELNKLKIWRKK